MHDASAFSACQRRIALLFTKPTFWALLLVWARDLMRVLFKLLNFLSQMGMCQDDEYMLKKNAGNVPSLTTLFSPSLYLDV